MYIITLSKSFHRSIETDTYLSSPRSLAEADLCESEEVERRERATATWPSIQHSNTHIKTPATARMLARLVSPLKPLARPLAAAMSTSPQSQPQRYHFSHYDVTDQVFLRTPHAIGIVNVKPIVPGRESFPLRPSPFPSRPTTPHSPTPPLTADVLLIPPNNTVHRLADLPSASIGPFFSTLQTLVARLEKAVGATSSTVAIQDGEEAGQSVKHLHVHVLPRRKVSERDEGGDVDELR